MALLTHSSLRLSSLVLYFMIVFCAFKYLHFFLFRQFRLLTLPSYLLFLVFLLLFLIVTVLFLLFLLTPLHHLFLPLLPSQSLFHFPCFCITSIPSLPFLRPCLSPHSIPFLGSLLFHGRTHDRQTSRSISTITQGHVSRSVCLSLLSSPLPPFHLVFLVLFISSSEFVSSFFFATFFHQLFRL